MRVVAQPIEFTAMDQRDRHDRGVHAAIAQAGEHDLGFRLRRHVPQQDPHLFELLGQDIAVVGISRERSSADNQVLLLGDRQIGLYAELVGLLERQCGPLGQPNELRMGNQPAVSRKRDHLLLHRGIHDHALELGNSFRLQIGGNRERGHQRFIDAGFAERLLEPRQVHRRAWQARLKILLAADVLEIGILSPALAHRLIRQVIQALTTLQAFELAMHKQRHHRHFDLRKRHPRSEYREQMAQIDHRIQTATEEIVVHCGILKLQIFDSDRYAFRVLDDSLITRKPAFHHDYINFLELTR